MIFRDRKEAGERLAESLAHYRSASNVIVLALPRGGVPVGHAVARALRAPLDVFVVRKLGLPGHPELAMGAIAGGGVRVLNRDVIEMFEIDAATVDRVAMHEQYELARREVAYRGTRSAPELRGRIVVLVDDGLATGSTMRAAVTAVRLQQPARIVVAVPVGAAATCKELRGFADEVVCVETPEPFHGVGQWYYDFDQTSDAEVQDLLGGRIGAAAVTTSPRP